MRTTSSELYTVDAVDDLPDSLQDIFTNAFECVARVDYQGCYLSVNAAYAEVCGYTQEEMVGMAWQKTVHSDDLEFAEQKYREVLDTGRAEAEIRGIRKNNSVFYKQLLMVKGLDSDASSIHHYFFINDITERVLHELIVLKSVKAGLELQEQQFHDLIKDIPGVVFQCDANDYWSFSYLSPTIEKLLGIPSYQLLTQGTINYASLICEDDRERVRRIIDFAISENKSYTIEYRITRTDGVVRWFRERATSKTGELGEKISIGGIICDITESKQSEKQLQIAQILIDNAGDLVLWMDEEGRFVYANNIACEVLGYERDELLNLNAFDVDNNITSETPRTFLNTVSRYHSASVNFESTVRTKNDREIKLDIISNVVEISGEIYTCVLAKNITTGKGDKLSLHIHQTIHQLLVANTPQQTILETLCSLFEEIIPHSRMALFILDENDMQLHLAASPSLHQNLAESLIDIIPINPATGNYNHEDVVIKDLLKNTLWKGNEIVEDAEVSLACRIAPFYSNGNNMLGSLVILLEHNSLLSDYELEFLHKVGNLASLVVETSDMREQLLRFEKIIESTDDLIVYVDSEYCFRVVSNRYAESHNSTREKIVGKSYPDIVGEKMFYENIRPYLDRGFGGEYVEFKEWFEQTLNDRRYYQVKINPVRDGQKIIGVIIIMRDITQMFNVSEALRETEGRYQSVLENSTDIMVISHLVDGEIVTANEAFSRATGHEPKDYIGAKAVDFYVNPQDRNVLVNRLTREGHCADFETQITTKDGRKVPVLLSCSLIEYDDEQCILTVARDLSDRKLVEEELKDKNRSISLLQKITVAANEASSTKTALQIVLDEICEFCHWPVGHAYILNTTTENLESCCVWHTEPVDKFAAFKQLTEKTIFKKGIGLPGRVLDKKSPVWIEDVANDDNFPRAKSDRNIDVISAFGFPVLVEDKVVAVLEFFNHCLIAKDEKLLEVLAPIGVQVGRIIERKQAEKALRQSQVNFSKAVNACPDSVVIIRLSDGKILDINDAVLEATGYSREELIENGNGMMFWVDEQACKDHAKTIKRQGKVVNYSMLTKRKDGSTIPCLMSSTLIDVDGDKCAFSIVKDISDLTIAYEEIRQRERQAQVITDSTSVCISYVDTDLRYVFNNMEFQQEFGIDKASILGKTIIEVVGAHRYEHLKPYISTALSGKDVKFEMAINNSRGEELVYELTYHPDRKGGVVKGIYIASSNITERKNTELALTKTNRALRVLSECSKILVKEREEEALLQAVCNVVIEEGGYQAAWVGYVETEKNEGIQSVAFASGDHGAVRNFDGLEKSPINTYLTRGVISSGGPLAVRNSPDMIKDIQWRAEVVHDRYVSALGLPLKSRGIFLGVMVISSTEVETFDEEEIKLFASMAENLTYGLQSIRESRKRKKAENLLALENHAFQLIATLPALPRLLDDLVKNIEMQLRNKHCLLLLLNDGNKHFYDGASPSMDENYVKAVIGPVIEENSGPCSRAAYLKERITVEDTHTDPFWKDYCQLERDYHYHSCCVTPITAADGRVLGTFTIYSRETGTPDRYELQIVDRMTFIIGGAVDSYQVEQALKENEERFVLAMKGSQDGLWDVNLETNEAYWSPRWKSMLGYAENELEPSLSCFLELLHPDDKEVHEKIVNEGKDNFEVEYKMKHKQGHYVDILSRATGLRNNSGKKVTRLVGTHTDLTERNRAALRIKESERQFRTLYDDSPSMFLTLDENGIILSINKFGADHLGFSVASLIGKSVFDITHDDDGVIFMQKLKACTSQPEKVQRCEIRELHKYGDPIWVRATMRSTGLNNDQRSILVTCEDISEARILSEQLEYQANHDALTGLINRVEFEKRLRRVLNSESDDADHALCYLDLDQFKVINDTCGHLAGDELLRRVGDILNTVVRKRDTLARMGGDEFAVLLEHCPLEQAKRVATELLHCIETLRFVWDGKRFALGVSIGLVPMRAGGGTLTDILSAADEACYAAKDAGRNRVHVFYSDDIELSRRRGEMEWVSKINQALEEDRFCLDVQAIGKLNSKKGEERGNHYEILLRMRGDDGQLIFPGAFLPAAERYNLSDKIDQWVVNKTLEWLTSDRRELEALAVCSINLSGHSMGDESFLSFLLAQFHKNTVPPDKICFEITETAAIGNLGAAIQFIHALKEIGCLFALDDFGTGVSSFNYLKNLPVDYLKIDGSFIRGIDKDPIDFAMVRSINEIGQVMGKETIAEFVENDDILEVVRNMGINYAQGYAIGRPVPIRIPNS